MFSIGRFSGRWSLLLATSSLAYSPPSASASSSSSDKHYPPPAASDADKEAAAKSAMYRAERTNILELVTVYYDAKDRRAIKDVALRKKVDDIIQVRMMFSYSL